MSKGFTTIAFMLIAVGAYRFWRGRATH